MTLSDFAIENFGALRGVNGTFAPRLTVLWGENDSGKSTLFHFIRRILFVRKTLKDDPYQPQNTKIYGAVSIRADDGRSMRLALDGRKHLIGMQGSLMTSMKENFLPVKSGSRVFTIELSDLLSIQERNKNTQGSFFYAEAGADLPEFLTSLNRRAGELYSPADGAESEVGRLWAEVRENDLEIESLETQNTCCAELRRVLEEKLECLDAAKEKHKKDSRRLRCMEAITGARAAWLEARDIEKALSAKRRIIPKDSAAQMDILLEKVDYLKDRLEERKQKRDSEGLRRRSWEANPVMSLLAYREVLEGLKNDTALLVSAEDEMSLLAADIEEKEKAMKRGFTEFIPDWTEAGLLNADVSLSMEQAASLFQDNINALRERKNAASRKMETEDARILSLNAQAESIRGKLDEIGPARADYQKAKDLYLGIREELLRSDDLYAEIRSLKMCADILDRELTEEDDPPERRRAYMANVTLGVLIAAAGIFVTLGYLEPRVSPYDFYGLVCCAAAAPLPLISIFMSKREHSFQVKRWRARYDRRNDDIDAIEEKIISARQKMHATAAAVEEKSQILGIRVPSTINDLDTAAELLEAERDRARLMADMQNEEKRVARSIEEAFIRKNRISDEVIAFAREIDKISENWRKWLAENRFDPGLRHRQFFSVLTEIRGMRKDLQLLNESRRKFSLHMDRISEIKKRAGSLSGAIGLSLDGENLPAVFRSLREAVELKARADASREMEQALAAECAELERQLASTVGEVRAFCEQAGVDGEAAFRVMVAECARSEALESRLTELRRTVESILGGVFDEAQGGAAALRETDFLGDALAQAEEIEELRTSVADGEQMTARLSAECRELQERIDTAAQERLSELRQKNALLRSQAEERFKQWLTLVLTGHFAARAADRHKAERQPEIAKRALEIFPQASGAEEKYIAVKLAAASYWNERVSGRFVPAPVILDDVLVPFGDAKQREIMDVLWRFSERCQVVLFTRHRSTAEMFRSHLEGRDGFLAAEMPKNGTAAPLKLRTKESEQR